MAYKSIPFSQHVNPGTQLQFLFNYSYLLFGPSNSDLQQALDNAASVSVVSVKYDVSNLITLGASGTIQAVVTEATTPQDIASDFQQLLSGFTQIRGAQITEVDIYTPDSILTPSVPTTISLVAIAAIAIVGLILFLKIE